MKESIQQTNGTVCFDENVAHKSPKCFPRSPHSTNTWRIFFAREAIFAEFAESCWNQWSGFNHFWRFIESTRVKKNQSNRLTNVKRFSLSSIHLIDWFEMNIQWFFIYIQSELKSKQLCVLQLMTICTFHVCCKSLSLSASLPPSFSLSLAAKSTSRLHANRLFEWAAMCTHAACTEWFSIAMNISIGINNKVRKMVWVEPDREKL